MVATALVGVDCAVKPKKMGLAFGHLVDGCVRVDEARCARERTLEGVAGEIAEVLRNEDRALVALDAPLGWPAEMARRLATHRAGEPIAGLEAHTMFRRTTDRLIAKKLGKTPLDVGADRIARTAFAALELLRHLRAKTDRAILLAWRPRHVEEVEAIEVYPAGTLTGRGISTTGYKAPAGSRERDTIVEALCEDRDLECSGALKDRMRESDHVLDAVLCLVAAADFVRGERLLEPADEAVARQEGWIWVRAPETERDQTRRPRAARTPATKAAR